MNKVDTNIILRVLRNMSKVLGESNGSAGLLDKIIANCKLSIHENNLQGYLVSLQLLEKVIIQTSNKETYNIVIERLIENRTVPPTIQNYDLSTPEGFLSAMEDELIREMVSGASIGGRMSGLGTNQQVNSSGMAGSDPLLGKKKNKIIKVLTRKL